MATTTRPLMRSQTVEAWLDARGVKYAPAAWLPMSQIKRKESRANQARPDPIIPEVVDRYVVGVRNGDPFPPIVVYKSGNGYVIVDGNHRDESHVKAGEDKIAAYVLDPTTPSEVIEFLTVGANGKHGQPTDTGWRIRQALQLIATGQDPDLVYADLGVSKSQIEAARRAAKADERARRVGVYGWDDVSPTSRGVLAAITSDPVFSAAADVAIETAMGSDDLKNFVRQLKAANSEADALRIVGEVGDRRRTRKGNLRQGQRNRLANPRMRVSSALGAIVALNPSELPRLFHTEDERKEIANRCAAAALVLMEMEEVLRDVLGS